MNILLLMVFGAAAGFLATRFMRVQTDIITTIFMPLSFIAAVYGMNFNPEASPWNMPELNWAFGYPTVWGIMILVWVLNLNKGTMHFTI